MAGSLDGREDNGQTKLDEPFLATLYEIVDKQPTDYGYPRPTWTQELLAKVMAELTGVAVHPGTISRGLKQIGAFGWAGPGVVARGLADVAWFISLFTIPFPADDVKDWSYYPHLDSGGAGRDYRSGTRRRSHSW